MRPPRARLVTALLLLLLALGAGCSASDVDSPPVGGSPGGGSGGGPGGGGPGGGGPGGGGARWQRPARIDDGFEQASEARVAVDPASGDAVALWLQSDDLNVRRVRASRLDRSAGAWGAPDTIDDLGTGDSSAPQLAADGQGNFFAVWVPETGAVPSVPTVWVARRTAAGVWQAPHPLDAGPGAGKSPAVAANDSGVAVVAWIEPHGADDSVWVSWFDPSDETWSPPDHAAAGSPAQDAASPAIDVADTGDLFVAWVQRDSPAAQPGIWVNRFDATTSTWDGPMPIDDLIAAASSPQVGADRHGNAVVLWEQGGSVHAAGYLADEMPPGWTDPVRLDTSGQTADQAALAVAPTGHAVAVWRRNVDGGRVWASRLEPSGGTWSAAVQVETSPIDSSLAPDVALDASGNAVAVWQHDIGTVHRIRSSRLAVGEDEWSDEETVKDDAPGEDATAPRVAVDAGGDAVAVWLEEAGGVVGVWGNVYE